MSAEMYDADLDGSLARPAIDILPTAGGRKAKSAAAETPPVPEPEAAWTAPLVAQGGNPWGEPVGTLTSPPEALADGYPEVPPGEWLPETDAAPKKFLGMALRRPKKDAETAPIDALVPATQPQTQVWVPPTNNAAPVPEFSPPAPLAAWPTDVAMPVVANAEPEHLAAQPDQPPMQPAVPTAVEGIGEGAPAAEAELQALRALLAASEAGRLEAENRAALSVTYAQAAQAQLTEAGNQAKAKLDAAQAQARSAAGEAQDWQIRHREAESTIAELAISVASAEQRLGELRSERDDLMTSLEDATRPDHVPTSPL